MILSKREQKLREQPNNRFILMMSIMDVLQSLALMFSTLALPRSSGKYGAMGNEITCSIQGFLIQIGISVPCYNACLCIWFLLSIKYNMQPRIFAAKYERYCHAVSLGVPFLRSIIYASVDKYVPRGDLCGGAKSAILLVMVFTGVVLVLCLGTMVYCLAAIYCSFNKKEKLMRRYSTSSSGMQWRRSTFLKEKRQAAKQGVLYSCAFLITFLFPVLNTFIAHEGVSAALAIISAIFYPLQGFFNFMFYTRRSIKRIRTEYPELSLFRSVWELVFHPDNVKPKNPRRGRGRRGSARRSSLGGGLHNTAVSRDQLATPVSFKSKNRHHQEKQEEDTEDQIGGGNRNYGNTPTNRPLQQVQENSKSLDVESNGIRGDIEEALAQMEAEGLVPDDDDDGGDGICDHHDETTNDSAQVQEAIAVEARVIRKI